jgi:1-acyl-sn-glycerol-3-phosphate acyltransferase
LLLLTADLKSNPHPPLRGTFSRREKGTSRATFVNTLRAAIPFLLFALNTLVHVTLLLLLAVFKAVPIERVRTRVSAWLVGVGESWIACNTRLTGAVTPTRWRVEGMAGVNRDGWYLVVANHQSWVDIPVLQAVFNRRAPFLKFFLKRQLRWVPALGAAWWALDFPFMHRHTRAEIERRPELRGQDREATQLACRRFARLPTSVMNFLEGTRFTPAKHAATQSPYARLLPPRAGGVAFVLDAMGGLLRSVIDVTIAYPGGRPSLLDLLAGRIPEIRVDVRERPIPEALLDGDYEGDAAFRQLFQAWINGLWAEKDATLARLHAAPAATEGPP